MNTDSFKEYSWKFAAAFLQERKGNSCVSPASLYIPFAAAASAAGGTAKTEIDRLFSLQSSHKDGIDIALLQDAGELCQKLQACEAITELQNSITFSGSNPLQDMYKNEIQKAFGSMMKMNEKDEAAANITLYNSISFKDKWKTRFDERRDIFYPGAFYSNQQHSENGEAKLFLHYDDIKLDYRITDCFKSVSVPFDSDCYMTFAMPVDRTLDECQCEPEWLREALTIDPTPSNREVELFLPAFRFKTEGSMVPSLKQLGISEAFSEYTAALPYMAEKCMYIDEIKQKAAVEVNAKGASAKAETFCLLSLTIGMRTYTMKPEKITLRFDHPFAFAIWLRTWDKRTEGFFSVPLFVGTVREPNGKRTDEDGLLSSLKGNGI